MMDALSLVLVALASGAVVASVLCIVAIVIDQPRPWLGRVEDDEEGVE